jgi:hypothetical protein
MTGRIAPVAPDLPIQQSQGKTQSKTSPSAAKSAPVQDSVQLSSAAQTRVASMQEATEGSAQTAREAQTGDRQAQTLLAKEAASAKLLAG